MQNYSVYPDHLSVLSRALLCFFSDNLMESFFLYESKHDDGGIENGTKQKVIKLAHQ